jgi:hypothetical protein
MKSLTLVSDQSFFPTFDVCIARDILKEDWITTVNHENPLCTNDKSLYFFNDTNAQTMVIHYENKEYRYVPSLFNPYEDNQIMPNHLHRNNTHVFQNEELQEPDLAPCSILIAKHIQGKTFKNQLQVHFDAASNKTFLQSRCLPSGVNASITTTETDRTIGTSHFHTTNYIARHHTS